MSSYQAATQRTHMIEFIEKRFVSLAVLADSKLDRDFMEPFPVCRYVAL
jgi:hypothetical protein